MGIRVCLCGRVWNGGMCVEYQWNNTIMDDFHEWQGGVWFLWFKISSAKRKIDIFFLSFLAKRVGFKT